MIIHKGVAYTDGPCRNKPSFTFEAVLNSYLESPIEGVPVNIGHDRTKLHGWTYFTGMFIEPGMASVTNSYYEPETQEEKEEIQRKNSVHTKQVYIDDNLESIQMLRELLGDKLSTDNEVAPVNGVALRDNNILYRVFPDLAKVDKKGLTDLTELKAVAPGIFKRGSFLIYAHPYFRRNCALENDFNDEFLSLLQSIKDPDVCLKIKLDPNLIGLSGTESSSLEYEFWWGPKFNDDLRAIPYGITRHKTDEQEHAYTNIDFTEFRWYEQDSKQTLECEEVIDIDNIHQDKAYYGCRYVHSNLNMTTGIPQHLDGAIRIYDEEQILERTYSNLANSGENTAYCKLWRIDGIIPLKLWKELITHFYRDNLEVGKYLGGQEEQKELQDERADNLKSVQSISPRSMNAKMGLRCYIQKKALIKPADYDVRVKSNDYIFHKDEQKKVKVVEGKTLTILKYLRNNGCSVRFPVTSKIIFDDMIYNFPVFICKNEHVASKVMATFFKFCEVWKYHKENRLISFSIAMNYSEYSIQISFAGHVNDFCECFTNDKTRFPSEGELVKWAELFYTANNRFQNSLIMVEPYQLISGNGELSFKREIANNVGNTIKRKGLTLSTAYLIGHSLCNKCEKNFIDCKCIPDIEDGVKEILPKATPIFRFWTDKPI